MVKNTSEIRKELIPLITKKFKRISYTDKQNMADNEIKLNISFSTTQDLLFNTVLINNFKNVDFSFNSMKSSSLQKIKFPKQRRSRLMLF